MTGKPATTPATFRADLRAGGTFAGGRHGGHRAIAGDAYGVALRYLANLVWDGLGDFRRGRERVRTAALVAAASPLALAPLFLALRQTYEQRRLAREVGAALAGSNGDFLLRPDGCLASRWGGQEAGGQK